MCNVSQEWSPEAGSWQQSHAALVCCWILTIVSVLQFCGTRALSCRALLCFIISDMSIYSVNYVVRNCCYNLLIVGQELLMNYLPFTCTKYCLPSSYSAANLAP